MISIKFFLVFELYEMILVDMLLFTVSISSKIYMNLNYRPWITALHIRVNSLMVKFFNNRITTTDAPTEPAATTNSRLFPTIIPKI